MRIIESIQEMQAFSNAARSEGRRISFVPTMGYLHQGHASLMREARRLSDIVVTSIFVNPTQFGAGEDFDAYPRDMERDKSIAEASGVDIIFAPKASAMYPRGYETYVDVERLTLPLCGASRPGHFRGVTTVVCKLFNIVMPHIALFGEKDFQQLAVIRRMVEDLNMGIEILGMPIVREEDGLAMSSRNAYLSPVQRQEALCLKRALDAVRTSYMSGELRVAALRETALAEISKVSSAVVDYAEFCDKHTLDEVLTAGAGTLLALAVRIGTTRLIDNTILGEE
ncbi:pantoate--beta-alanine ligase [Geobacter sp. DSM 9736]|uniref:pantoate--beta-alanine ligase n=1 Tax=Geobacter sp. DSM 9736 TaxID=1277350 RepID=UPI000B5133E7|nr:pantoate--beta-alanine ligase [Geobacter sp. DSM 9736]SNB45956.1 pantothenate synthetase [Geobacter sp. DSM 9736]